LPRRAIAEALVLALLVVEAEPGADAGPGLGDRRVSQKGNKDVGLDARLELMTPCRFASYFTV
jgi:hypothetical protein